MKPKGLAKALLGTSALAAAFALVGAPSAHAVNAAWNTDASSGNFNTAQWTSGTTTPVAGGTYTVLSGDALFFGTSTTTTLTNDLVGATYAGLTFNSGASAYTIGGNSFTLTGNITNNSTSTQTINNAIAISGARTINAASGQLILGGNLSGNAGTTTLSGNNKITLSGTNSLTMTANFGGLIINGAGGVDITGSTTINGAAGNTFSGYMNVNGNSTLTVQSGGSLAINGTSNASKPDSGIGNNVAGTSTILVNGGTLTYSGEQGLMIGNNLVTATGVLTVSSGTATINAGSTTSTDIRSFIAMGRDNANGVINLNGGTLETGRRFVRDGGAGGTVGAGTANFNFNGGTLKALADQTAGNGWFETATTGNQQVVTTTVKAGGAKIDTNGFNANINTVLEHDSGLGGTADGGLTKTGVGTLTLSAANTYTGATLINNGTLALGATASLASTQITVANATTLTLGSTTSTAIADTATLLFGTTSTINLNNTGTEVLGIVTNGSSTIGIGTYTAGDLNTFFGGSNFTGTGSLQVTAVPEPSAALLGGLGLLGLLRRRRVA